MIKTVICTVCPLSCEVELTISATNEIEKIMHNRCPRGKSYATTEHIAPRRTLTTTVHIEGAIHSMLPVRTYEPIPKELLHQVMQETANINVTSPIKMGDIIVRDILGTGVNLIATRSM